MAFVFPTLDQLHAMMLADYANRIPGSDVSKFSDTWKRQRTTALGITALSSYVDATYDNLLPDTADMPKLQRFGAIYNVTLKQATPASGAAALRVFGSVGSTVNVGDQLVHTDGTRYQVNSVGVVGGGGYVDVDILAIDVGSITKKTAGTTLAFVSAPPGLNTNAVLELDLTTGGNDTESEGAFRARLLARISQPGMGGNANDYKVWAETIAGVDFAYVFPLRAGLGSVHLAFLHLGRGSLRAPSSPEIAAVQAYVDSVRPVSVADFLVLPVSTLSVDVEMKLSAIDAAHARDWNDASPLTVASWNGTTRVLQFTTSRPADITVGDRLVYKSTAPPYGDGSELIVEALGPGSDEVTVEELTTAQAAGPPVAGNAVYSGGPLIEPARDAVLAIFDSLGPGRASDPSVNAGTWEDQIRVSSLYRAGQGVDGVSDTIVVTPVANVVALNDDGMGGIQLEIPRQILVRYA